MMAWLEDEPSADHVEEAVRTTRPIASWINLGEVAYNRARRVGWDVAVVETEAFAATITAELPDEKLVLAAARFKAAGRLSYADAFAAATAERHDAPLLTGDPELVALDGRIRVIDLRG
ncbi:MAG: PIN domain-containing protein [Solirubrobacterales bacterium]|nr:PIN domain-containing protein [Solirubrobacterales bacterium]